MARVFPLACAPVSREQLSVPTLSAEEPSHDRMAFTVEPIEGSEKGHQAVVRETVLEHGRPKADPLTQLRDILNKGLELGWGGLAICALRAKRSYWAGWCRVRSACTVYQPDCGRITPFGSARDGGAP